MNSQYKKGVLELCVLSLLKKRDCYGYEISEYLSRHIDIADGTVYPILRKLKADGLLTTYLQEESGGAAEEVLQADFPRCGGIRAGQGRVPGLCSHGAATFGGG